MLFNVGKKLIQLNRDIKIRFANSSSDKQWSRIIILMNFIQQSLPCAYTKFSTIVYILMLKTLKWNRIEIRNKIIKQDITLILRIRGISSCPRVMRSLFHHLILSSCVFFPFVVLESFYPLTDNDTSRS